MDSDLTVAQHVRGDFLRVEHRFIEPGHDCAEAERTIVELQLVAPRAQCRRDPAA
jgi:hypothetical protein